MRVEVAAVLVGYVPTLHLAATHQPPQPSLAPRSPSLRPQPPSAPLLSHPSPQPSLCPAAAAAAGEDGRRRRSELEGRRGERERRRLCCAGGESSSSRRWRLRTWRAGGEEGGEGGGEQDESMTMTVGDERRGRNEEGSDGSAMGCEGEGAAASFSLRFPSLMASSGSSLAPALRSTRAMSVDDSRAPPAPLSALWRSSRTSSALLRLASDSSAASRVFLSSLTAAVDCFSSSLRRYHGRGPLVTWPNREVGEAERRTAAASPAPR